MNVSSIDYYPPAVVVGLNDASFSIVRSLGRKGIPVIGLYKRGTSNCYTTSKYLTNKIEGPIEDDSLVDVLINDISARLKKTAVLFCGTDESVLKVSKYEKELKKYFNFVIPNYNTTKRLISKKEFHKFALNNSIEVPQTFFTCGSDDLDKVIDQISFPCIVKPEYKGGTWSAKVPSKYKAFNVESKEKLICLIDQYGVKDVPLVIQEWIDGEDSEVYFCLLYISRNHQPLAICTGQKLLQYPRLTGSTSIAETVRNDEVRNESLRLLKNAGMVGFCSVEFKYSRKNSKFYVTEPTVGRPDTQEGLAISAGLDIPYIAYLDALNNSPAPFYDYKLKVRWINEPLAFYNLQESLREGMDFRQTASLFAGNLSYGLCSCDDAWPFISFIANKIYRGGHRLLKTKPIMDTRNRLD